MIGMTVPTTDGGDREDDKETQDEALCAGCDRDVGFSQKGEERNILYVQEETD